MKKNKKKENRQETSLKKNYLDFEVKLIYQKPGDEIYKKMKETLVKYS